MTLPSGLRANLIPVSIRWEILGEHCSNVQERQSVAEPVHLQSGVNGACCKALRDPATVPASAPDCIREYPKCSWDKDDLRKEEFAWLMV